MAGAVDAGALLAVLLDCFKTDYNFDEENHRHVEIIDSSTFTWMRDIDARFNTHLAISRILLEQAIASNALLLFAQQPDVALR